jgi:ketosteroid isomerase-like protein
MATISDPVVRDVVAAINAGDRSAFLALLAADATMSGDGTNHDLHH